MYGMGIIGKGSGIAFGDLPAEIFFLLQSIWICYGDFVAFDLLLVSEF